VIAIAPCNISRVSTSPNDDLLFKYCDKVNWYVYAGTKDDICSTASVQNVKKDLL